MGEDGVIFPRMERFFNIDDFLWLEVINLKLGIGRNESCNDRNLLSHMGL